MDRDYSVGCSPEERDDLVAAARMLDQRMRDIRGNNRMAAIERIAVLAALNLAHELQQTRHQGGALGDEFDRTLGDLERKLGTLAELPERA
ncbi:cell division protein ZapA [Lysobacter silvestris]